MKKTIDWSTIEINIEKQKVYYKTLENYNTPYCILFEDLRNLPKNPNEHYLIIKELLRTNYPEELL